MIKLIVVEDQLLIQKDICRKLEKTGKDIQIAATAMNGEEAYEKIKKLRPDVLITDIRMPIQSGLELIHRLCHEHIDIRTIILSGYRDFEYAKEAMKLNVDEYLLKPVSIEDLYYALDSLEKKLDCEKSDALRSVLSRLLAGKEPGNLAPFKQLTNPCYRLLLINMDSCYTFSILDQLPYEEELRQLLSGSLPDRYLESGESALTFDGANCNEKIILFCLNEEGENRMKGLLEKLSCEIEGLTRCVTLCLSSTFSSPRSVGMEYRLLKAQMTAQLIFGHSSILYGKDFLTGRTPVPQKLEKEWDNRLSLCARGKNAGSFCKELHKFLHVCNTLCLPQRELEKALKGILDLCFPSLSYSQMSNAKLELDEYISNSKSYEELALSLDFLLNQLFNKIVQEPRPASDSGEFVDEIRKYIEANYSQDVNIQDIAAHFSISPAYLSRIFKKYLQVRPIEYLTGCRIRHACHYFAETQLTVGEVAELCGYSNQFYFSKAFKQITTMSPSEYRIQNHKQEV